MRGQSEDQTEGQECPWTTKQVGRGFALLNEAVAPWFGKHQPGPVLTALQNRSELREAAEVFLDNFLARYDSHFKYDKTKTGWWLVRPEGDNSKLWPADPTAYGPTVPVDWDPSRITELLEPVSVLDQLYTGGIGAWQYILKDGFLDGQYLAEWLNKHRQHIPRKWRFPLVFLGTVWRCPGGCLHVPCLDEKCLDFPALETVWGDRGCLVRRRDPSSLRAA